MPLIDYWKLEGQRLVPFIQPGERVLAYTATGIPPTGEPQRLDEPGDPEPPGSANDRLADVVERALTGSLIPPRYADKMFSAPAGGLSSSVALRLLDELRGDYRTSGLQLMLAVTSARVLLLVPDGERMDSPLRLVADLPRAVVATAQVHAKPWKLSFGRLRLVFRDGSWMELTGGPTMGRTRANQARDAIVSGKASVDGEPGTPPDVG
jgi:hypothetical protein